MVQTPAPGFPLTSWQRVYESFFEYLLHVAFSKTKNIHSEKENKIKSNSALVLINQWLTISLLVCVFRVTWLADGRIGVGGLANPPSVTKYSTRVAGIVSIFVDYCTYIHIVSGSFVSLVCFSLNLNIVSWDLWDVRHSRNWGSRFPVRISCNTLVSKTMLWDLIRLLTPTWVCMLDCCTVSLNPLDLLTPWSLKIVAVMKYCRISYHPC